MPVGTTFRGFNVLCWTIDSFDQLYGMLRNRNFNLSNYLQQYKQNSYDNKISLLYEAAPIKLNLGGETEKSKLVTTAKPIGVFDFSLASTGLYRVTEYYSDKLAKEYPDKFKIYELPSGVVPPNLVKQDYVLGQKRFYYVSPFFARTSLFTIIAIRKNC